MKFQTGVCPWTVGTEEQLAGAGAAKGLHKVVKLANSGSVGIDIWVTRDLIDHLLMSFPVICKAAEVWNDEVNFGILWSEHIDDFWTADNINQDGQAKFLSDLAHLACRHSVKAVHFDAAKAPPFNRR